MSMNPSKNDLKPSREFGSKDGKLPAQESIKPKSEFPGSAGKGSLPKSPSN